MLSVEQKNPHDKKKHCIYCVDFRARWRFSTDWATQIPVLSRTFSPPQIKQLEIAFVKGGGFRERMTTTRIDRRNKRKYFCGTVGTRETASYIVAIVLPKKDNNTNETETRAELIDIQCGASPENKLASSVCGFFFTKISTLMFDISKNITFER